MNLKWTLALTPTCAFWSSSIVRGSQSGISFSISKLTMARASMDPLNCRNWLQAIQWRSCLVRTAKCWDGLNLGKLKSNWGLVDTAMAWNWKKKKNHKNIILVLLKVLGKLCTEIDVTSGITQFKFLILASWNLI